MKFYFKLLMVEKEIAFLVRQLQFSYKFLQFWIFTNKELLVSMASAFLDTFNV
jgi:hypothetical protein